MAPAINREAIIVLLDVSSASSVKDIDGTSNLEKAKQCLSWIIKRKILSASKDEIGIILLGSEETRIAFTEDDFSSQYENINVLSEHLGMATWNNLREVENINGTCINNVDWLDGIVVAVDFLRHSMEGKVFSECKIVLLSKCLSEIKSCEQLRTIVDNINNMNINVVVIGPDVASEENEYQNTPIIAKLVDDTKGVICSFDDALNQLRFYNKVSKKPMGWKISLTIGPDIKIPVVGYKKIDADLKLGWVKRTVDGERAKFDQAHLKQDEVIDPKDIIEGYEFGSDIIPFSEVEKQTMAYNSGDKCLTTLGFTSLSNLPNYSFMGNTVYYFLPQKNDCNAAVAFTTLVKALEDLQRAIIVRKVWCRGYVPTIGAMIPKVENDSYFLLFLEVPYAEYIVESKPLSLNNLKPSEQQINCIDKLISAMDLTDPECFEDDDEPYIPQKLINPFTQHVDNCIVFKALNKNKNLPSEPEKIIQDLYKPLPKISECSEDILEEIKVLFSLEIMQLDSKQKKSAVKFDPDRKCNTGITDVKSDVDKDARMENLLKTPVLKVSSLNPETDFHSLLKSGTPFNKACEQLQSVIIQLFITQTDDGAKKPLSAMATLRKKCLEINPEVYNNWLGSLKDVILEKGYNTHWNSIVQENLGLINKEESEKSNIGIEEASLFYEIKKLESEENAFDEGMDAEDLLDMM